MNKLNIADLLKDCPSGMELNCTMYEDVYFDYVDELQIIHCYIERKLCKTSITFNQYGTPNSDVKSKCVIFPKGKTTWEGFVPPYQFKNGDIAISDKGDIHILRTEDSSYCAYRKRWEGLPKFDKTITTSVRVCRIATEEEKQVLFDAIKENGYRWNAETKTLEKLPKFRVGDTITNGKTSITIGYIDNEYYYEIGRNIANRLFIKFQDEWELVPNKLEQLIQPKFKVGDRIRMKENHNYIYTITGIREKENKYECGVTFVLKFSEQEEWELAPNKFDINTLKPFDKVLVRTETFTPCWTIDFYDGYRPNIGGSFTPFGVSGGKYFQQCIPYEGNQHLSGTTNDCDEFFKNWKPRQ